MKSVKLERLDDELQIEISKIIQTEIKDKDISFVTITGCDTSSDLGVTKVYITVLDDSKKKETLLALNNASKFIRKELASRIKDLRHMPELRFLYDSSIEYGNRIDEIIENINKEQ